MKALVEASHPTRNLQKNPSCPICSAANSTHYSRGSDRLFGVAQGTYTLYRCTLCGCVFQNPVPTDSALATFYPREYWWSEGVESKNRPAHLLRRLEKIYREFVAASHVRLVERCARQAASGEKLLLDIGCGNGTFLHLARSRGFVPHGMDGSARAVEIAQKEYGLQVRHGEIGSKTWIDAQFDFVTMFHVLEHLSAPKEGLKYAWDLLKPGGSLIVQVPNVASIQARIFRGRWYGLDVPRHVISFTPTALKRLFQETGFDFRLINQFSLRDDPASIASSLVPWLDPIRRKGRRLDSNSIASGALEIAYFGVVLLALPLAFVESAWGFGGTIWANAKRPALS